MAPFPSLLLPSHSGQPLLFLSTYLLTYLVGRLLNRPTGAPFHTLSLLLSRKMEAEWLHTQPLFTPHLPSTSSLRIFRNGVSYTVRTLLCYYTVRYYSYYRTVQGTDEKDMAEIRDAPWSDRMFHLKALFALRHTVNRVSSSLSSAVQDGYGIWHSENWSLSSLDRRDYCTGASTSVCIFLRWSDTSPLYV